MPSRWDHLFEAKPVPLISHVLEEVAKLLARELVGWPPPIQEVDPATLGPLASVLTPGARPPNPAVYPEAFRLARWRLERAFDAYDDYLRNRRYLAAGLPEGDRQALLFLERWLEEQMLALTEATEGRIKRPQLGECLERTEHQLRALRAGSVSP